MEDIGREPDDGRPEWDCLDECPECGGEIDEDGYCSECGFEFGISIGPDPFDYLDD